MQAIVPPLLSAFGIYLVLGLLFGVAFAFFGVKSIDPAAAEAGLGFKLIIVPGAAIFWPLLLRRWLKKLPPPTERSAHRDFTES